MKGGDPCNICTLLTSSSASSPLPTAFDTTSRQFLESFPSQSALVVSEPVMRTIPVILACFIPLVSWGLKIVTLPESFVERDNPESDKINLRASLSSEEIAALDELFHQVSQFSIPCRRHLLHCLMNAAPVTRISEFCYDFTTQESCIKGQVQNMRLCQDEEYDALHAASCGDVYERGVVARNAPFPDLRDSLYRQRRAYDPNNFSFNVTYSDTPL